MGRRPREEQDGGIYHIIQRGNNRSFVFEDDTDKEYLVDQLWLLSKNSCKIYGFVIMGNHYHLVIRTAGETLQSIMHRLNLKYSKYYNRTHNQSGHVFQGRYKAIPVREEKYLLSLLRYVHQNPVKAGVCSRTEEYKWSSERHYRGLESKNSWLDTGLVLDTLSSDRKAAVKMYMDFMAEEENGDYENRKAIGDIPETDRNQEIKAKETKPKTLDEILAATGVTEEDFKLIKTGSRRRSLTAYKLKYSTEALALNYTYKATGENIKISDVAIIDMIKKKT